MTTIGECFSCDTRLRLTLLAYYALTLMPILRWIQRLQVTALGMQIYERISRTILNPREGSNRRVVLGSDGARFSQPPDLLIGITEHVKDLCAVFTGFRGVNRGDLGQVGRFDRMIQ